MGATKKILMYLILIAILLPFDVYFLLSNFFKIDEDTTPPNYYINNLHLNNLFNINFTKNVSLNVSFTNKTKIYIGINCSEKWNLENNIFGVMLGYALYKYNINLSDVLLFCFYGKANDIPTLNISYIKNYKVLIAIDYYNVKINRCNITVRNEKNKYFFMVPVNESSTATKYCIANLVVYLFENNIIPVNEQI